MAVSVEYRLCGVIQDDEFGGGLQTEDRPDVTAASVPDGRPIIQSVNLPA